MVSVTQIQARKENGDKTKVLCFEEETIDTNAITPKNVLGSSPDEEILCSSKTKHKIRTAPRQNLFLSERRLQELSSQARKLSWVRVSMKILGLGIIFSIILNDT
jgi:hypothetical protein